MIPDLTLPTDPASMLIWVAAWATVIGLISVRATDGVLDFWTTKLRSRYGVADPRAAISEPDQRLVSVYAVPPLTTLALYLLGLALGWVALTGQWVAMVVILAIAAIGGKTGAYALKEKFTPDPSALNDQAARDNAVLDAAERGD